MRGKERKMSIYFKLICTSLILGFILSCIAAVLFVCELQAKKEAAWENYTPTVSCAGSTTGIVWGSIEEREKFFAMSKSDQKKYLRELEGREDKNK